MSLADLKKKKGGLSLLQQRINEMKNRKGGGSDAEEYWKLTVDAAESGVAEIRFLPAHAEDDFPFVKIEESFIKGVIDPEKNKPKWYINRSLKCVGEKNDPVNDEFWALMNSGDKDLKEEAKKIRERTNYIVWIYVVSDRNAPHNEGKVFKTKLSPSIWEMIEKKTNPDEEAIEDGAEACDVFCPWDGATFKLRAKKDKNGMRTYETSTWLPPAPLFADDDKLEEVYNKITPLKEELSRDNKIYSDKDGFKTYERLEARLEEVLGRPLYKNQIQSDKKSELANGLAAALADDENGESFVAKSKTNVKEKEVVEVDLDDSELDDLLDD